MQWSQTAWTWRVRKPGYQSYCHPLHLPPLPPPTHHHHHHPGQLRKLVLCERREYLLILLQVFIQKLLFITDTGLHSQSYQRMI